MGLGESERVDQPVFSGNGTDDPAAYRRWITPLNVALLVGALLAATFIIVLIIQLILIPRHNVQIKFIRIYASSHGLLIHISQRIL